jgi:hypothetical protein
MLKKVIKFIKFSDVFGSELTFRHQNQVRYKTINGGLATLTSLSFIFYIFFYFSADCFNKTNPVVRDTNFYEINNSLNFSKHFFAFYFTDQFYRPIPNPSRYLAFHAKVSKWDANLTQYPIQFSKCDLQKHFGRSGMSNEYILSIIPVFQDSYCVDLEDDFYLINGNTQIPRSSIEFIVSECSNSTIWGVDCKT